ncbi:TolC family protein [Dokdonella soli]|uniref:TolC family protein n=1 Tax=Dokdonella soli TaxID=529810 RepID=A0ABN1IYK2_9GAMM
MGTTGRALLVMSALLALAGCASYASLPLGDGRGAASAAGLSVPAASLPLPALATHRFDPSDGLDVTEVAMLAVANNPDLKVKRDELGIARAQAFSAGLLPDPQLSLSSDFPSASGQGLTKAFNLGISEDLSTLLTRSSRLAAATSQADQVNLDLLWAEWQTVAQARLLFGQVLTQRAQQARLDVEQRALEPLGHTVREALRAGNLTYDSASAGLNAESDVQRRLTDNAIALHLAESDLRVLLGLAPSAPLDLVGEPYQAAPTPAQVEQALANLPQRRPDLLALQAGYHAQEEKLREAILAQFPALTVGFTRARDTSSIYTSGFTIGLTLPLFNRNRGAIATETATRQRLKDDYDARLLTARSDLPRLLADLAALDRERAALDAHAHELDEARSSAERTWQAGLLDWPTYLAIRSAALAADLDLISVRQEQAKQATALEALLGNTDFDTAHPASAQASKP